MLIEIDKKYSCYSTQGVKLYKLKLIDMYTDISPYIIILQIYCQYQYNYKYFIVLNCWLIQCHHHLPVSKDNKIIP